MVEDEPVFWIVVLILALAFVGFLVAEFWGLFMNAPDRKSRRVPKRQRSFQKPRRRKADTDVDIADAEMKQKVDELIAASTHDKPHRRYT